MWSTMAREARPGPVRAIPVSLPISEEKEFTSGERCGGTHPRRPPNHRGRRTFFTPDEVLLVVEVVSLESAHRDGTVKLRKYAEAGITKYWRVEAEDGAPVVHAYELDGPTRSYVPTAIHRRELHSPTPFAVDLDLDRLVPGRRS
ncbi:Uma2 family endonuclease [Actinoplanes sp. NPDC049681]|uniref:Uma2 family endonuclease n=1 Tax=Actinoplanes sp. NPDC049681 TaxID=3363905 RepID=UPI0037A0D006